MVTARVLAAYKDTAATTAPAPDSLAQSLTDREREVLRLVGRGLTNSEIAEGLHIAEVTVKSHLSHIFTKLNIRDRAAAIVFSFDHGLVRPRT
jgi:DNA-binding NarL/FixJ family response regulator